MRVITLLILVFYINSFSQNVEPFIFEITTKFPNVRDIAIAPNGQELMFTAQSVLGNLSVIMLIKKEGSGWSVPEVAPFSGQFFDLEPFYSPDGLTLYFVSTRALNASVLQPKDFDIWYVERQTLESSWSSPKNMGNPINTEHGEFYPSIAANGNFYFTRDDTTKNRKDDIYVSEFKNHTYQEPKVLSDAINSEGYEYNAFIAPDESYLIFGAYNRMDGLGSGDLYISRKTKEDWTKAKHMGKTINSDKMDYCPFVMDNMLYFTSKRDHTQVTQETPLTYDSLLKEFNKAANGSSKLYKIPLKM